MLGHGTLPLPPLLTLLLHCEPHMLCLNRRSKIGRILCRLLMPAHVCTRCSLIKCFALHVACSLTEEVIRMLPQEVVLRFWEVPMMEGRYVSKAQVPHLTQQ